MSRLSNTISSIKPAKKVLQSTAKFCPQCHGKMKAIPMGDEKVEYCAPCDSSRSPMREDDFDSTLTAHSSELFPSLQLVHSF